MLFAGVVPEVPVEGNRDLFFYQVPDGMAGEIRIGSRVLVPFGRRTATGYVVRIGGPADLGSLLREMHEVKELAAVLDAPEDPVAIYPYQVELALYIAGAYLAPLRECLKLMLPPLMRGKSRPGVRRRRARSAVLEMVAAAVAQAGDLVPTEEQAAALRLVRKAMDERKASHFLLHGITGSGKTEVYLQAIAHALEQGRQALFLVPEIALTPQTLERVVMRLGSKVAILHSGLTDRERQDEWERIACGDARVVVGSRSALFAPLPDLGLIVLDEEDSSSYKQDRIPRYHAVDVALHLSRLQGCPLILGSATPRVETYYRAHTGGLTLLTLADRPGGRPLPSVDVVDMREELKAGNFSPFSLSLARAVAEVHGRGGQIILFINRRGSSPIVLCRSCGYTSTCEHCSVSLVYHERRDQLACHYCGATARYSGVCPECGSRAIKGIGAGTERIEKELNASFPGISTIRMDRDTVVRRDSYFRMYEQFRSHEADCLIGTQMVAKGLDIAGVELVGIINADTSLRFPDYRAGETTFSLLTQVAGRAGRGDVPGRAILQTYSPTHYAIEKAVTQDYLGFAHEEIRVRKALGFPPYGRLAVCTFSHPIEASAREQVAKVVLGLREVAGKLPGIEVLGPSPAFISRLRAQYQWQCTIRGKEIERIFPHLPFSYGWSIDVDPGM